MARALFLTVEGLSGTGKTSVASSVARRLRGECVQIARDFAPGISLMTLAKHVDARLCMFASALLHSSVKIRSLLDQGIPVIVDGYVARTLAYHRGMGARVSVEFADTLCRPDFAVFLECEETERRRRLTIRQRPKTIWDDIELANLDTIRSLYRANRFPIVDTTRKTPDEVVSEILALCGAKQKD